jgi:elongation factor 1-beta
VKPYSTAARNAGPLGISTAASADLKDLNIKVINNNISLEVMNMGEVVATIKLMPESPEVDLEKVKEDIIKSIPEGAEFHKIEEEPIAFGLVALKVMVVVGDSEGGTEKVEENLSKVENVSSVEVEDVRRLM